MTRRCSVYMSGRKGKKRETESTFYWPGGIINGRHKVHILMSTSMQGLAFFTGQIAVAYIYLCHCYLSLSMSLHVHSSMQQSDQGGAGEAGPSPMLAPAA